MIISASRRTDIPAFYSEWFLKRIKEGYCTVPNPFNAKQVTKINLSASSVDAIVFWTRNAKPILEKLDFLSKRSYKFYFQYTINNFEKGFEPNSPNIESAINTFKILSNIIGPGKVIWRYDPIIITETMDENFHINNFQNLANQLNSYTKKVVVSIVDDYKKTLRRVFKVDSSYQSKLEEREKTDNLLQVISEIAHQNNLKIETCAEKKDYSNIGIKPGKCIDDKLILDELGVELNLKKDKNQRKECGCVISKDVGMNNSCIMGCEYCYATISQKVAIKNFKSHNPNSPSLLGWHEAPPEKIEDQLGLF